MTLEIVHQTNPSAELITQIEDSLRGNNIALIGEQDRLKVVVTGCDAANNLQAGIVGVVGWNWLFISMLWVAEGFRGQGYGTALLLQAEKIAKENGCVGIYVDTMSFQAPDFYKKHGYAEFGRLEDFPIGHSRIWLKKAL